MNMKKLFGLFIIAALFAFSMPAKAQGPVYGANNIWTMWSSGTVIALPGAAATNIGTVIKCDKQKDVALQITLNPKTTATDAIIFYFQRSVDGVTYMPTDYSVSLAPSGTAGVASTTVTNIPAATTFGIGFLKLQYVTNAAAAAGVLTNCSVSYASKISAP